MSNRRHRREPIDIDPPVIEPPGFWARLSEKLSLRPPPGPVCVAEPDSRVDAELMVGFLRSRGVHAEMLADDLGDEAPGLGKPDLLRIRVVVPSRHAGKARDFLADANET